MTMTKKERLQAELAKLEAKQNELVRQKKLIQSCQLQKLIDEKRQAIKDCEYYEYQPLNAVVSRDELTKNKVYARLLEIALAADYLVDCAIECKTALRNLGIGNISIMDDIDVIRKHANKLSGMPCDKQFGELYDFMMDNDRLIDDLHLLSRNYIGTKLKAKEYTV